MSDFKPGLEGVVAVETEIAEPDREGGSLRYRGIDIDREPIVVRADGRCQPERGSGLASLGQALQPFTWRSNSSPSLGTAATTCFLACPRSFS